MPHAKLAPRELEVLQLMALGLTARETAEAMGIGRRTVDGYLKIVRLKTGTRSRFHMVAYAVGAGLIQVEQSPLE